MKTNGTLEAPAATSQPGNVTVRQLAASLRKTPATAKEENGGGHRPAAASATESTAETHEAPPPEEGETQADENLEQEHTEGAETEAAAETTDAAPETESTEATDSTEETAETESAENAEPALSEAMAARIDAELAPLIDELTKAGAKGALQILQKRIPKLVDQRDTERNGRLSAEQQVSQLRQELQDAKSGGGSRNEGR